MSVSADYLLRCAAETGFQAGTLERVVRLGDLAADIARHPRLGDALALKGGTPLNLGFGPPRRLSIDLDYNYVAQLDRDSMLAERPEIEAAVVQIAERQGFRVQTSAEAFAGRKLHLHYAAALDRAGVVQIDLNYLHRLPLDATATMTLWQPGELDRPSVRAVGLSELLVGKLLALLDRGSPRDAWDVANLPPAVGGTLLEPRFRRLFLAMAAALDLPLPRYRQERLSASLTDKIVADQLSPMLSGDERPDAGRLAAAAWEALAPLVHLTLDETAFFAAIDQGDLRLELLFPDDTAEAIRLALHPALQWKITNARGWLAGH